ncbi:MAG: cytochrome P450 [Rhodobacterales bacterium]|nr:cytochrome P450 [Rhodobacterales bacterium]MDX5498523.1 cytochrome P450 [Rhodobacterales bacterium]
MTHDPLVFDPTDAATVNNPYPTLLALQRDDPAHWSPRLKAWVLTRYEDVRGALASDQMSVNRIEPFYKSLPPADQARVTELIHYVSRWLVFRDPPEHTRLRKLLMTGFSARAVNALRPGIEEITDMLLDRLPRGETFDFVNEFAMQVPGLVIMDLLGVPRDQMLRLKACSDRIQLFIGSARNSPNKYDLAEAGAQEMAAFFRELIAERRMSPRDDMISTLVAARDEQDALSEDELIAAAMLVLFGGHETTTNLLAGGMFKLVTHRDQADRLRADPALARPAVEECLRLDGPSGSMARVVAVSHDLHGKTLGEGDRVFAMINAANQDPSVFENPGVFDIGRTPNRHVTFGFGTHFCMGSALARMEGEVVFPRVLDRYPTLRMVTEDVDWHPTMIMRGPRALPMQI